MSVVGWTDVRNGRTQAVGAAYPLGAGPIEWAEFQAVITALLWTSGALGGRHCGTFG